MAAGFDPSFPFYTNDWLSSPTIDRMTLAEQGAFIRLLAYCWQSQNVSIPDDDEWLADVSRLKDEWPGRSGRIVKGCFIPHPELSGMLTNKKLFDIWSARKAFRLKASEAGKKSGKVRRKKANQTKSKVPSTNLEQTYEPPMNET